MTGHDLWADGERVYRIPHGIDLDPGDLRLTRIDGVVRDVAPGAVAPFLISIEEAATFHQSALDDAAARVGAAIGAMGHLMRDGAHLEAGPRPESLDELLGWAGRDAGPTPEIARLIGGMAALARRGRADPEAVRRLAEQVADRWEGGEMSGDLRRALRAVAERLGPDEEPR